jgi:single-strand DNA-binding protein
MASVNKAILIGNLGKDPELRRTPGGSPVVSFSLATTDRWVDKNGARQEKTEWHNIVAWGKLAELANQYLKKGRGAYIEGRITNRSWDDRDGNKKYRTEIVANQIQFIGSGAGAGAGAAMNNDAVPDFAESQEQPAMPAGEPMPGGTAADDDLPF